MPNPDPREALEGFAFTDWPDLTCERAPHPQPHISTLLTPAAFSQDVERGTPFLFLALARVLGAYCGASDILLARKPLRASRVSLVRAIWNNEETWGAVSVKIASQLHAGPEAQFLVKELREALGLQDKQYPCLAVLTSCKADTTSASEFPLTLHYDSASKSFSLASSSTFIHPSVSDQLLAQVVALLEHALSRPTSPLSPLPVLPGALSSIYNRVAEAEISKIYPHISQVEFATNYLQERAISHPHAVAVRWFPVLSVEDPFTVSESVTYFQLDQDASRVARWLVARGLQPEDRVAVCLKRNLFFHAAVFGIMRAAGCYVPIDPELPAERKAYIGRNSNATFVLTTADLSPPELFGSSAIYVDEPENQRAIDMEDGSLFNRATADGLSYMLYTSGTTGNPKGCLLTNKGLAQAILALSSTAADVRMENLRLGRYLAVASIAFDVHLAETITPFALGMPLFSAPRSELLEDLPHYVNTLGITHLGIVPSLIEATLNAASDGDGKTNLRYIASGGEKMSDSILDKWANHPQVRLANFYGPSEVTIGCCARYMDPSTPRANIGRPLANVSGYVVDSEMQILPRGGVGELVVEGPLVGRGYHGRPDLTEKVFLEWPQKACWAYRTGDLVRMLPDSTIEILGRIDTQIKLRGVRIESEGISAIVRKALPPEELTLDATTILAKHPSIGSDQLVSFVTWTSVPIAVRKSTRPTISKPPRGLLTAIRNICNVELASYMRPSHVIPLTWLPLSSNGKTDAKILLDLFQRLDVQVIMGLMTVDKAEYGATCSELEEAIFAVLKEYGPSHPGPPYPDLSVFECGLDSLAVIRFTSGLKEKFQRELSASDIMKNPLLKDIARLIQSQAKEREEFSAEQLVPLGAAEEVYSNYPQESVEMVLPPLPIQQGVVSRSSELDTLYVQHVILQCKDGISIPKLRDAWKAVISRHPMLRTVFFIDQLMLQIILKFKDTPSIWSEWTRSVESGQFVKAFLDGEAVSITKDINHHLSSIPPLRTTLYSLPSSKVLVLSIHHALYDGVSLPLVLSDTESAYSGTTMLPVASLQNILGCISSHDFAAAQKFWTTYFAGFLKQISPFKDDWQETSPRSMGLTSKFKAPLSSVKAAASKQQVTLQALLSHAFAKLIATRLYQTQDVCFGVIRSGRLLPVENIESAICPTISLLPVRVNFNKEEASLPSIQASISEMVDFENVPLSQIQTWVRPGETLFDVVFSMSVHHNAKSGLWDPLNEDPPPADYPLAVEAVLHPEDDTLTIRAGWLDGYLTNDFVSQFLQDFETSALDIDGLPDMFAKPPSLDIPAGVTRISQPIPSVDDAIPHGLRVTVSEFLGVDSKVLHDSTSFISLGLDSIKAVGLAKRITKLGYKVTSTEVLKGATIENLARAISGRTSESGAAQTQAEARAKVDFETTLEHIRSKVDVASLKLSANDQPVVFPATALQSGMLSQTIASSGVLYVHNFPMVLPAGIDFERLRSSWRIASDMFSILRTSFHFIHETGTWTQVVHSKCRLNWSSQETSSEEDFAAQLQELLSSPWDEDTAFVKPPLSLRLFIPSPSSTARPRLVLIIHHGLYDGLSLAKLMSTVESLYQENPLPSPVQFVSLLPEILHQERDGTEFWSQHLRGYRLAPLPRRPAASAIAYTARKRVILNTSVLASALSKTGVTLQCFFQAGLAKLLSSLTRSNDVVFGHVVSGRGIPGSEDVIGPMLNTIPCRVNLGGHESNLELLQKVHKSNLDVLSWQQASLRSVQKAMGLERLWDCLFAFQPMSIQNESIFKMESSDEESRLKIQYALHVEVEQEVNGFEIRAASHCDGFESRPLSSLVDDMAELFLVILDSVCDGKVGQEIPTPPAPLVIPVSSMSAAPPQYAHSPSAPQPSSVVEVLVELKSSIPPALLKILREVVPDAKDLNLETVLTSLGVDSISAIQVAAKCRRAGLPVKSADLINARTLGDVVAKLSPMPDKNGKVVKVEVEPKTITQNTIPIQEYNAIISRFGDLGDLIEQILPMTPGMKFLVSEWQRSRATKHQNTFPFSLPPDVDSLRLRNAWKLLFKRYPIVRSTCASAPGSGEPRLVTFKPDCGLEQWAEETLDDENFHHRLIDRLRDFSTKPLSIHRPPVRLILFRSRSRHRAYLCIHIHHLQYDATSFHLITKTLGDIYDILEPEGHGDITPWLSMFPLQASWKSSQEAYWKSALPSPFRPVLFPRLHTLRDLELKKTMKRHTIANTSVTLRVSDCDRKARALGTSLNAIILAVWASVHARYARSSGATFGLWQGGRSGLMDDVESLVAPCINITPVHVPSTGDILAVSRHLRDDLVRRSPEVVQSDFEDIHRWTRTEGSYLLNTTLNILRIPKSSEVERLLEPVKGPYTCPDIAAETITSTLDAVNYSKFHQDSLSVEVAIVEKTDQFFMAIEGDGTYITEDQTRRVLDDFVVEFMRVFSD